MASPVSTSHALPRLPHPLASAPALSATVVTRIVSWTVASTVSPTSCPCHAEAWVMVRRMRRTASICLRRAIPASTNGLCACVVHLPSPTETTDKTPDATPNGVEVSTRAPSVDVSLSLREKTLSGMRVVRLVPMKRTREDDIVLDIAEGENIVRLERDFSLEAFVVQFRRSRATEHPLLVDGIPLHCRVHARNACAPERIRKEQVAVGRAADAQRVATPRAQLRQCHATSPWGEGELQTCVGYSSPARARTSLRVLLSKAWRHLRGQDVEVVGVGLARRCGGGVRCVVGHGEEDSEGDKKSVVRSIHRTTRLDDALLP